MNRDLHDEARRLVIARDVRTYGWLRRAEGAPARAFPSSGAFEVKVDLDAASEYKLAPLGVIDHVVRAATYEWKCTDCGDSTYVGSEGGSLDFESCECDHTDGHNVDIWVILNGKRTFMATAAAIEGSKPGEPSKARLDTETQDAA